MSVWKRLLRRVAAGPELPAGFTGTLEPDERIVTMGELAGGGHLVLTQLGLWVPEGAQARRIGWHLVSKAVWDRSALVAEAAITLLAQLPDSPLRRDMRTLAARHLTIGRRLLGGTTIRVTELSSQEFAPLGAPEVITAISRKDGITSSRSMTHRAIRSNQPPKYAANEPMRAAMPVDSRATRKPMSRDLRSPRSVRASMSRPLWVVPSRCRSLGGFR